MTARESLCVINLYIQKAATSRTADINGFTLNGFLHILTKK